MADAAQKQAFKDRVRQWAERLDVKVVQLSVRPMRRKWASCSSNGRLNFNSQLLGLDAELWDYVIVHELLHFSVPNHGRLWGEPDAGASGELRGDRGATGGESARGAPFIAFSGMRSIFDDESVSVRYRNVSQSYRAGWQAALAAVIVGVRFQPRGRDWFIPAPKAQPRPESLRQKDLGALRRLWRVVLVPLPGLWPTEGAAGPRTRYCQTLRSWTEGRRLQPTGCGRRLFCCAFRAAVPKIAHFPSPLSEG